MRREAYIRTVIIQQSGTAILHADGDRAASDLRLFERALECSGDVVAALALAVGLGRSAPLPGSGGTLALWQSLATIAAADPTVARIVEPHLDALAILAERPDPVDRDRDRDLDPLGVTEESTWGVFAAEAPGAVLDATPTSEGWVLSGTKAWCSLAGRLSHCLVTARDPEGRRGLFAAALGESTTARDSEWAARGLIAVPSGSVDFDRVRAVAIGEPGWYLERHGFAWGGMGVAAIWWGATVGIARRVALAATSREPDQIGLMHLGRIDESLWAGRVALREAAAAVDEPGNDRDGPSRRAAARLLAARTRSVVARSAENVIRSAGHALGPAPLALDAAHAGRVADLELYLRQHHAERDSASLGALVLTEDAPW